MNDTDYRDHFDPDDLPETERAEYDRSIDEDQRTDTALEERSLRRANAERFARDADRVAFTIPHDFDEPVDYPTPPPHRHVMIVELDGLTYVAPHLPRPGHGIDECERVAAAARVFLADWDGRPRNDMPACGPGRYWVSAGTDGNLEIGGRVYS